MKQTYRFSLKWRFRLKAEATRFLNSVFVLKTTSRSVDMADMQHHLRHSLVLAVACLISGGCGLLDGFKDKGTPTEPAPTVTMDAFAGSWASQTASAPATGCGTVKYTVVATNATTGTVTFEGTCAGSIKVTGSGAGKVVGDALEWSAQGLVAQGGVNCPFTFANGKAKADTAATIKVDYSGTVCGIPVTGSEVVKK